MFNIMNGMMLMANPSGNSRPREPGIEDVQSFWEENPLFTGESKYHAGTREFFEEHRRITIDDCLAGEFDQRILPPASNQGRVLDLGCGPGFWTIELLARNAARKVVSADLTEAAVSLTRKRLEVYGLDADVRRENAEALSFEDESFDHVNCQGVIHHTPDTEQAIAEIARILRPGGTASLSVYYLNGLLRIWPKLGRLTEFLANMGFQMPGRGRERILTQRSVGEIVRYYDGKNNPVGKVYTKAQFLSMLEPHFHVTTVYYHLFPKRALPFPIPRFLEIWLEQLFPFLIYVNVEKRGDPG